MSEKVIYSLYRSLLALLAPVVLFYALLRVVRDAAYARTLRERLGFLPSRFCQETSGAIWIHAVSVGEVIAAGTLIRKMRRKQNESFSPPVFVSTTTLAGYAAARDRLDEMAVGCFYAPIDYVNVIRRVLHTIQPSVVVVLETEIWPNLFREAKRAGCGLIIANGRISDRALPAYRRRRWFFRRVLCEPDVILVQSRVMRERFIEAGAPPERIITSGNLKFDFEPCPPDTGSPVLEWLKEAEGPVLIGASTTADEYTDEDQVVLNAFTRIEVAHPDRWKLILAPRKPERFNHVAELLSGRKFWRRSAGHSQGGERILLLDTIGELSSLFGLADVVFMGGTLTATGGHNFLEPAFTGKPVVVGPRLENFREIAGEFQKHHALISIDKPDELAGALQLALLDNEIGPRARELAEANQGAAEIAIEQIRRLYAESLFSRRHSLPARILLKPLAALWILGGRRRLARELRNRRSLQTPVISIGNITVGGTGKTPFVLHLARRFRERGLEPVVLTRGYGRISHRNRMVLARGATAAVWHTGDEPQILLRSGQTGLGVGADRYLVGRDAEFLLDPDVFLIDDGFSHQRLARDVEIVLIDSLDPFGGGDAIPLGRLREPLEALRRADLFVITRCAASRPLAAIERRLRGLNERAPIFRSRIVTREWISLRTGAPANPPERAIAFCGLGNPGSFWHSLEQLGINPLVKLSYGDHHSYAPRELQALVRHAQAIRAAALLTTEKDLVNFHADTRSVFGEFPVFWLRVDVEIENEAELVRLINPADIRARQASDRRLARGRR